MDGNKYSVTNAPLYISEFGSYAVFHQSLSSEMSLAGKKSYNDLMSSGAFGVLTRD